MKNKKLFLGLAIIFVLLFILGGSYAFWIWNSNTTKNVIFNTVGDLKNYIVYDEGESKFIGKLGLNSPIYTTIAINKTTNDVNLVATIHMNIKKIGSNMNTSQALKWKVTEGDSSSFSDNALASGNFINVNSGDTLTLADNIYVRLLTDNNPSKYTIWVWLDSNESYDPGIVGETLDVHIWTDIGQIISTKNSLYTEITSHEIKTNPAIGDAATTDADSGVYKTTQDGTDIYYYRGAVKDNNVLYGGYCWKIIRTTKTGGIKMIYNGLPDGNNCGTDITTSQLDTASLALLDGTNTTYKMQDGGAGSPDYRETTLRTLVDTWFANINSALLETTDFCIDAQLDTSITDGYQYTAWSRYVGGVPTLECTGTDRTVFNSKVGLISADELLFAGAPKSSSSNNRFFYLYNNKRYWTISPHHYDSSYWNINYVIVDIYGKGGNDWYASTSTGVRPVISLASGVSFTGSGTYNDPYIPS